ncbi:MAG: hypothetical protein ACOC5G_00615 [Acidobacteriota bacterium]
MNRKNKPQDSKIFKVECPCCGSLLWIDSVQKVAMKFDKKKKKKGNLDDLLLKEKQRRAGFETTLEATSELAKERQKEAQKKYKEALTLLEKKDPKD